VKTAFRVVANGIFKTESMINLQAFLRVTGVYENQIDGNFGLRSVKALQRWVNREHEALDGAHRMQLAENGDMGLQVEVTDSVRALWEPRNKSDVDVAASLQKDGIGVASRSLASYGGHPNDTIRALQHLFKHGPVRTFHLS